jgi:5-formyltetrahydrofolate cyclo-ligase
MPDETHQDDAAVDRAKSVLRLHARAARRSVLPEEREAASYAIAEQVLGMPELAGATAVALYGASPEEADPAVLESALRERGVRISYPRVAGPQTLTLHWVADDDALAVGAFGLREPPGDAPDASITQLTAIIVPGVAFDASGNRLGFGGGFYDALLADATALPLTIGIAYDEQIVDSVPHDDRDQPVDVVVTPTRTLRCATRRP